MDAQERQDHGPWNAEGLLAQACNKTIRAVNNRVTGIMGEQVLLVKIIRLNNGLSEEQIDAIKDAIDALDDVAQSEPLLMFRAAEAGDWPSDAIGMEVEVSGRLTFVTAG